MLIILTIFSLQVIEFDQNKHVICSLTFFRIIIIISNKSLNLRQDEVYDQFSIVKFCSKSSRKNKSHFELNFLNETSQCCQFSMLKMLKSN
ncbi:hypothetical protein BpHYR1_033529 [Brachionus plicatilis]|uniref:Uncharacterized protein n=1 Tax=Brachionus plicatilis TaxID=10195 RepID=A0A3M7SGC7_BRAPC|nr:hypothetical protein BpHYR1_033529 [Brachionus plicatilis]